ncbi:sensor domain-containing diguanylate cyclase [Curvivirga sp.]|uniref:sensor domain-containing diguanylate cyclase n=1 Tax=Curvivirga sp. TaxID=2856848 RepID=UPI003B5A1E09
MAFDTDFDFAAQPHPEVDIDKWQQLVNLIAELYDCECGTIVHFHNETFTAVVASINPGNFLKSGDNWPWKLKSFCRRIIETEHDLYVPNTPEDPDWCDAPPVTDGPVRSYLGYPINWPDGRHFGTICAIDTKTSNYQTTLRQVLRQFSELINNELALIYNYEQAKQLSVTDTLTQTHNRRGLFTLGEQIMKEALRKKEELGFVYLDIDNLKLVNDHHGHEFGDEGLQTLAALMKETTRASDVVARVGGDEFVILFPNGSEEHLVTYCQRIETLFKEKLAHKTEFSNMGVSAGYQLFSIDHDISLDHILTIVDAKMYDNKNKKKLATQAS